MCVDLGEIMRDETLILSINECTDWHPIRSGSILSANARGSGSCIGQWRITLFAKDFFEVCDIGLVVVVL